MDAFSKIKELIPEIIENVPEFAYYKRIYAEAENDAAREAIIGMLAIMFIGGGHQRLVEVAALAQAQDAETDKLAKELGWNF